MKPSPNLGPIGRAAAFAPSNIALTKYWGKRNSRINLPLSSSISVTLSELGSFTIVEPQADLRQDVMLVDDKPLDDAGLVKVRRVLDEIRAMSGSSLYAGLRSVNTVAAAQGMASSASAFAALATAASAAYGLRLDSAALSRLARTGSGSASRSIDGGYVLWQRGEKDDGSDSFATQRFAADHWPMRILIAHASGGRKSVSSTLGMAQSKTDSLLFRSWIERCDHDVVALENAIENKDFSTFADLVEGNALAMHGTMLAGQPALLYWRPVTLAVIAAVRELRKDGAECCFTIDAGASVVILCSPQDARPVSEVLSEIDGIEQVIQTRIGPGARLVEAPGGLPHA